ncbi:MAG: hypothetical protein GY699_07765 [Desulfobacteraceae bacterium]|nr:hypothetical protein [Desulfobacteraceae bacterium]
MIVDIPKPSDFKLSGINYLNLSFSRVLRLLWHLDESEVCVWDSDGSVTSEYWVAAQEPLATAVTLLYQACEFLIKGLICEVSPYLLISLSPNKWPSGCSTKDISFSEYRTVDAQDLVKITNTVCENRLPDQFITLFDRIRRDRNKLTHTAKCGVVLIPDDILKDILNAYSILVQSTDWIEQRRNYLSNNYETIVYSSDHINCYYSWEILKVSSFLTPSEVTKYFGYNNKQRAYICPACDCIEKFKVAYLDPNKPNSESLSCVICGKLIPVIRESCKYCRGNVLSKSNICLSCGSPNEITKL